ncbi:transcriptional regulator [Agromyces mangrovi Wang et al. 2018]|nr:transcriptional regulator [Agromyces mangrovi]
MLDVAAAAGVSRSTVSNVMQDRQSVDPEMRERVLRAAEHLGYVYDRGAASFRMRQSHLIGLVIPDLSNPFIAQAVLGVQDLMTARGYLVVTANTGDRLDRQTEVLRTLAEHRVDGFLLLPAIATDADTLKRDVNNLPAVLLNRDVDAAGIAQVGPDDSAVGELGAEHLVEVHGCRTVAYFGGPALAAPRVTRSYEFRRRAELGGAEVNDSWSVPSLPTAQSGYENALRVIGTGVVPEGVHCHSDEVAFGVLRALRESAIDIDRCRVLGTDDVPDAAFANPSLSSISVDAFQIGRAAADQLLTRLGNESEKVAVPRPHFVARQSCGCVAH